MKGKIKKAEGILGKNTLYIIKLTVYSIIILLLFMLFQKFFNIFTVDNDIFIHDLSGAVKGVAGIGLIFSLICNAVEKEKNGSV